MFPTAGMTVPTNTMMLVSQVARDAELADAAGRVTRLSGGVHGALTSLDPPAPRPGGAYDSLEGVDAPSTFWITLSSRF